VRPTRLYMVPNMAPKDPRWHPKCPKSQNSVCSVVIPLLIVDKTYEKLPYIPRVSPTPPGAGCGQWRMQRRRADIQRRWGAPPTPIRHPTRIDKKTGRSAMHERIGGFKCFCCFPSMHTFGIWLKIDEIVWSEGPQ